MFDDSLSGFHREDHDLPRIGARIIVVAPRKKAFCPGPVCISRRRRDFSDGAV